MGSIRKDFGIFFQSLAFVIGVNGARKGIFDENFKSITNAINSILPLVVAH